MSESWYYRIGGQVRGPLDFSALRSLVEKGLVQADDEVRTGRSYDWRRVDTIGDLCPPVADADDIAEMLAHETAGPTRGRRRAKRVGLCYYRIGAEVRGPIPFEELGQIARSGGLDRRCPVRLSAEANWIEAGSIVGLFDGQTPPASVAAVNALTHATERHQNTKTVQVPPAPANDDIDRTWSWESRRGTVTGPHTFEEIHELAQSGRLEKRDKVRSSPLHEWVVAETIVGLFPDPEGTSIRPTAPVKTERPAEPARWAAAAPRVDRRTEHSRVRTASASDKTVPVSREPIHKSESAAATVAMSPPAAPRPAPPPSRPAPSPAARPVAAAPRPAPPRSAPPMPRFGPVRPRRSLDFGALFAGMSFSFGAKPAAALAVLVVGGLLWQFGLPSLSLGLGGGGGPEAEAQAICMELITLSDMDAIPPGAWDAFKSRVGPRVRELAAALEQDGDDSRMLQCCRDYLPKILEAGLAKRPPEWDKMVEALSTS